MADSLKYTEYQYGTEHELQKLGVWQFPTTTDENSTQDTKYWLV